MSALVKVIGSRLSQTSYAEKLFHLLQRVVYIIVGTIYCSDGGIKTGIKRPVQLSQLSSNRLQETRSTRNNGRGFNPLVLVAKKRAFGKFNCLTRHRLIENWVAIRKSQLSPFCRCPWKVWQQFFDPVDSLRILNLRKKQQKEKLGEDNYPSSASSNNSKDGKTLSKLWHLPRLIDRKINYSRILHLYF